MSHLGQDLKFSSSGAVGSGETTASGWGGDGIGEGGAGSFGDRARWVVSECPWIGPSSETGAKSSNDPSRGSASEGPRVGSGSGVVVGSGLESKIMIESFDDECVFRHSTTKSIIDSLDSAARGGAGGAKCMSQMVNS